MIKNRFPNYIETLDKEENYNDLNNHLKSVKNEIVNGQPKVRIFWSKLMNDFANLKDRPTLEDFSVNVFRFTYTFCCTCNINSCSLLFYCWVDGNICRSDYCYCDYGCSSGSRKTCRCKLDLSKLENDCIHDEGVFHLCSSGVDVHNITRNIWVSFTGTYSTIKPYCTCWKSGIERIEIKTEQKQEQIGRYEGRLEILDKP